MTATRTRWDAVRADKRRDASAGLPLCSRCGQPRVLNPCRDCATPNELAAYPALRPTSGDSGDGGTE